MKSVATFPSYEEANERQLDLLAAGIDALVRYVPTGWNQIYFGALPVYALLVPEEFSERALQLIQPPAEEHHKCLYRCPKCDSNDVTEESLDQGFGMGPFSFLLTLGIAAFARMLSVRIRGRKYKCRNCGAVYRIKP